MTSAPARTRWYELPPGARDWLRPGERAVFWLPPNPAPSDQLAAWDQLQVWDQLIGRMIRACLFDDTEDCRRVRKDAESVAAVGQALEARLDALT